MLYLGILGQQKESSPLPTGSQVQEADEYFNSILTYEVDELRGCIVKATTKREQLMDLPVHKICISALMKVQRHISEYLP